MSISPMTVWQVLFAVSYRCGSDGARGNISQHAGIADFARMSWKAAVPTIYSKSISTFDAKRNCQKSWRWSFHAS